ncbi:uncharacterized protein LOC122088257 [Macadamia integrifolia]|uniref:uncharacterized protein LOC122088257 n=1 Tax=Macadamia integrifolia TaxID=60698 RepID=UPI001C501A1D|nr:uncharacterized protein LOC122088257 [Macadamia integrifolia]
MISTERSIAMSNHPHRVLTPGASRKRKERDGLDTLKASTSTPTTTIATAMADSAPVQAPPPTSSSNRILAGYMAHEFLTQGTLFGQKWDPVLAKVAPMTASSASAAAVSATADEGFGDEKGEMEKVTNAKGVENGGAKLTVPAKKSAAHQGYTAVANLMKTDGTHIPGIINPTQLSQWLQI